MNHGVWDCKTSKSFYEIFKKKLSTYQSDPLNIEAIMDCALYADHLIEWYCHEKNEDRKIAKADYVKFRKDYLCLKDINALCNQIKHFKRLNLNHDIQTDLTEGCFDPKFFDYNYFQVPTPKIIYIDGSEININQLMVDLNKFYEELFKQ